MAIDLTNADQCARLGKSIRRSYDLSASDRKNRENLISIYADRDEIATFCKDDPTKQALLNLFALFVRGQEITLAHQSPRWQVNARTMDAVGFDKRIEAFLNRYAEILRLPTLMKRWAVDSAFGRVAAKIVNNIAPKGITSPVAPRAYRIPPDNLILDRSAADPDEGTFIADVYLVPLNEARNHVHFDENLRQQIPEYTFASTTGIMQQSYDTDLYAEQQTRLIDVYIPALGKIATWWCINDEFTEIGTHPPLAVIETKVNPYEILDLLVIPDSLMEISRLGQLKPLHLLANDLLGKSAAQARQAKRNPIAELGEENDLNTALNTPDGKAAFLANPDKIGLYTLPGPDPSVVGMGQLASQMFSEHAGNLSTALGISPGADTARQTQALIGQISQAQSVDRSKFETFLANVGKKLASLGFEDEAMELAIRKQVPGTKFYVNYGWAPPSKMPRIGTVDDYCFDVVPFSTAFRSPQERVGQLNQASQIVLQWMMAAAQGAPVDLGAIIKDVGESFDMLPSLVTWWSGEKPKPSEQAARTYASTAGPATGSDVRYQGNSGQGGGNAAISGPPAAGGLSPGVR